MYLLVSSTFFSCSNLEEISAFALVIPFALSLFSTAHIYLFHASFAAFPVGIPASVVIFAELFLLPVSDAIAFRLGGSRSVARRERLFPGRGVREKIDIVKAAVHKSNALPGSLIFRLHFHKTVTY